MDYHLCKFAHVCSYGDYGNSEKCRYLGEDDHPIRTCQEYRSHVQKRRNRLDRLLNGQSEWMGTESI